MDAKKSYQLIILAVLLVSCALPPTTENIQADNFVNPTSTQIQQSTIAIVSTDTPLSVIEPIPTDTPIPTTTPPPAVQTTVLRVDVSNLSDHSFEVRPNTDLTLVDIGNDEKSNRCNIIKTGFSLPITIPINSESLEFQLPPGEYRLICGIPNKSAKIVSQ